MSKAAIQSATPNEIAKMVGAQSDVSVIAPHPLISAAMAIQAPAGARPRPQGHQHRSVAGDRPHPLEWFGPCRGGPKRSAAGVELAPSTCRIATAARRWQLLLPGAGTAAAGRSVLAGLAATLPRRGRPQRVGGGP